MRLHDRHDSVLVVVDPQPAPRRRCGRGMNERFENLLPELKLSVIEARRPTERVSTAGSEIGLVEPKNMMMEARTAPTALRVLQAESGNRRLDSHHYRKRRRLLRQ
jgi:hypothetical protein